MRVKTQPSVICRQLLLVAISAIALGHRTTFAQATQPVDDAAKLYLRAADLVQENCDRNVMAPSASNLEYDEWPPYSADWQKTEKQNFPANQPARDLAHRARFIDRANWPDINAVPNVMYLNKCRGLSNELADAALYQHQQGDEISFTAAGL